MYKRQVLGYAPFQAFIGNMHPDELTSIPRPWYEGDKVEAKRYGRYGEIIPEDEFYAWLRLVDAFELVWLEDKFLAELEPRLKNDSMLTADDLKRIGSGRFKALGNSRPWNAVPVTYGNNFFALEFHFAASFFHNNVIP